jgi:hypothetical protein
MITSFSCLRMESSICQADLNLARSLRILPFQVIALTNGKEIVYHLDSNLIVGPKSTR